MKKLFKFAVVAAMLGALSIACKDGPEPTPEPEPIPAGNAAFTSFGFYADDNASLIEDYVAETIAGRITIRLPKAIDKSSLVARFETLENNEVYVGDVLQESGKTANNFNSIVDYEVVEPGTTGYTKYEVQLRNSLEMKLTKLGTYTTPDHFLDGDLAAAYSPKDGSFYIFYASGEYYSLGSAAYNKDMNKGYVIKWDGSSFSKVGEGSASKAEADTFDIGVDAEGTPYVLYMNAKRIGEDGKADGTVNGYASMRKFSGGEWSDVGGDLINSISKPNATVYYGINMVIDPATQNPITAWFNNTNNIPVARRASLVSFYNGTGWDTNISPTPLGTDYGFGNNFATHGNDIYYQVYQQNIKKYVFMKYEGGTTFGELFNIDCATAGTEFTQSGGTVIPQSFAVSPNGTLYTTVSSDPEGTWLHNIYRRNSETGALSVFGGQLGVTPSNRFLTFISFDTKNSPVVITNEAEEVSGGPVKLRVIDPSTNQWSTPVQISEKAKSLAVASDGNGGTFIAFATALPDVVIGQNSSGNDVTYTPYQIEIYSFALEEETAE